MSSLDRFIRPALIVAAVAFVAVLAVALLGGFSDKSSNAGAVSTTTTSGATTTTATDPAVADLQKVMTRLGYYSGPIDGVYSAATTAAVTQMQKALGVTADGIYGPATDAALKGKGKDLVIQIQTELTRYGYYSGPIDGHYGAATKAAVTQLQKDLGVTPDGLVGAETLAAFNKAVADGRLKPTTATTTTTTTAPTTTPPTTTTGATTTSAATTTVGATTTTK